MSHCSISRKMYRLAWTSLFFKRMNDRSVSTLVRVTADLDDTLHRDIESSRIKPKHHPGVVRNKVVALPSDIKAAIEKVTDDISKKRILNESKNFNRYLQGRRPPVEERDYSEKLSSIREEVQKNLGVDPDSLSGEYLKQHYELVKVKSDTLMKQRLYNWRRLDFTRHLGLVYLVGRGAQQYAVTHQIFSEISARDCSFKPTRVFDFGSGVGSVVWAANSVWKDSIREYYCVDASSNMNDLSEEIMTSINNEELKKRIFYRQFLPSSNDLTFDLVVSAYSLLELPSLLSRLETVTNLWNKTTKYLVLVELGTKAGFQVLNEARDYILLNTKNVEQDITYAHIFAPCPHDFACPRASDEETCNFEVSYLPFPGPEIVKKERYSYLVLVKGERSAEDGQWPRIVKPVLNKSRHTICRLCTDSGSLQEVIFTPSKHGKILYKCAKWSRWGDLLPCNIKYITETIKDSSDENSPPVQ